MARPGAVASLLAILLVAGCSGPGAEQDDAGAPLACRSEVPVTTNGSSASEVSLAIDPTDPQHLVAAANGFEVYTSVDGGATWTAERLTGITLSTSGQAMVPAAFLSDPAVAFSPDGTLQVAGLAYAPASAVFVLSRATPTGPWTEHTVWQSEVAGTFNDKEWLGIDPATGTMIVAWQREPAMDQLRTVEQALMNAVDLDAGLIVVSRSTDGGATWSLPQQVSGDSLHNNGTQVAFTADGRAHLVWVDYELPGIVHAVSTDQGVTWSEPAPIADLHIAHAFGGFTRMHTLPGLAVLQDRLAVVWHDARDDAADVRVVSYDGAFWGPAQRVPEDASGSGRIQIYPWAAFTADGTLHVSYYSGEVDGDFAYRSMALSRGAWSGPADLGPVFDLVNEGSVADLGDYTALAAVGDRWHAAWAQPDDNRSAKVHVSTVAPVIGCDPADVWMGA